MSSNIGVNLEGPLEGVFSPGILKFDNRRFDNRRFNTGTLGDALTLFF